MLTGDGPLRFPAGANPAKPASNLRRFHARNSQIAPKPAFPRAASRPPPAKSAGLAISLQSLVSIPGSAMPAVFRMPGRHRVKSALAERVAAQQPSQCHPSTADHAPLRHGNRGILRARRLEAASARRQGMQRGRDRAAVKDQQSSGNSFTELHGFTPSSVPGGSSPAVDSCRAVSLAGRPLLGRDSGSEP